MVKNAQDGTAQPARHMQESHTMGSVIFIATLTVCWIALGLGTRRDP